jgi:hypothetical protein
MKTSPWPEENVAANLYTTVSDTYMVTRTISIGA